jgi:hypothetical protein
MGSFFCASKGTLVEWRVEAERIRLSMPAFALNCALYMGPRERAATLQQSSAKRKRWNGPVGLNGF